MAPSFELVVIVGAAGVAVAFAVLVRMAETLDHHARLAALKIELRRIRARRALPRDEPEGPVEIL